MKVRAHAASSLGDRSTGLWGALAVFAGCTVSSSETIQASNADGSVALVHVERDELGCHSKGHGPATDFGSQTTRKDVLIVDGERSTVRKCACAVAGGRVVPTKEADTELIQCGTTDEWRVFYPEKGKLYSPCLQTSAAPTELRMSRNMGGILTAQNGDGLGQLYEQIERREGIAGVAYALGATCRHSSSIWEETLARLPAPEREVVVDALKRELQAEKPNERAMRRAVALGIRPPSLAAE